jgi:hypothetical protein
MKGAVNWPYRWNDTRRFGGSKTKSSRNRLEAGASEDDGRIESDVSGEHSLIIRVENKRNKIDELAARSGRLTA